MQKHLVLVSMLATTSAFAANFGAPAAGAASAPAVPASAVAPAPLPPAAVGPQAATLFRIVKPDGMTVIQQGNMSIGGMPMDVINVAEKDAFISMNGRCAFNVKFDEISATAAALNELASHAQIRAVIEKGVIFEKGAPGNEMLGIAIRSPLTSGWHTDCMTPVHFTNRGMQ